MTGFVSTFRFGAIAALVLGVSSCNKDLVERIDRLEAELRGVRSDTRENVDELKSRVIAAEGQVGVGRSGKSLDERLQSLEDSFAEVVAMKSRDNEMVYLRPNLQGHAPLLTDHGTFLVRLEGMDLNLESGGYTVHLNVGNPQAIAVQQFTLRGHHGGGTPDLPEDEEYSLRNQRIQAWQETLKPFEAHVATTLEPFSWTPFDIEIAADSRDELEMIRFAMVVENAQLNRQFAESESQGAGSFSHIDVESQAASVLKTEYGAFLVVVKGVRESDSGSTELQLEIGNPYGFTLNQCRLLGDYGPARPRRTDAADDEAYAESLAEWTSSLIPFESRISAKISNFRWSKASILIPAEPESVKFLRCQMRIDDVSLPAAMVN